MRAWWAACALLAPVLASPAMAQDLDMSKGGPIEVTSRDGLEWRQNEQVVIARGDARAVRGENQVMGDSLVAHYRKKASAQSASAQSASTPAPGALGGMDTGSNEVYRFEADGHVKLFNTTDLAVGDHAVYDLDQAVMVMTGKNMTLTTPNQVMSARDTLEYWAQKHMAVGRGLATVVTSDGRRIQADVLVAYLSQGAPAQPQQASAKPAQDPLGAGGKLERAEALGHVEVRTATETITGDRAVYVADSGIARIAGNVVVTRGQNRAVGDEAIVNMKTNVSRLIRHEGGTSRVEGLIVPNDTSPPGGSAKPGTPSPAAKP